MRAYAGRQFVPFLWWSLVWPGREANSRPTVREADTLPTEPTRHGLKLYFYFHFIVTRMIEELQAQIVGDSDSNELTQQKSPLQIVNWDLIEQDFLPKQYLTAKIRSKRSHHHHHSRQRTLTAYRPVAPPKVTLRILLDRCCRYGCNPHVYLRQACNY